MNERRARDFEHLPNLIAEVEVAGEEVSFDVFTVKFIILLCHDMLLQCTQCTSLQSISRTRRTSGLNEELMPACTL